MRMIGAALTAQPASTLPVLLVCSHSFMRSDGLLACRFDGEFRGKYEQEIKNSLDCGGDCTAHVGRISAGSVVVETSVFYLEGSAAEIAKALEDLETHLTHKPGSLFSSAFLAEFDHPSKVRIIRTKLGQARAADEPGAGNMPASGNAASGVPAREGQAEGELPANGGFHSTDVADAPYAPVDDRAEAVDPADGWFGDDFDDWFVEEEYEEEVADVARNEGVWPVAWMERMNGTMSSITENSGRYPLRLLKRNPSDVCCSRPA